ncbi:methionine synthase [Methanobrevibacter sp. TMH8]|uniref:methionine synthase n=1 Tax=Methanobrevibacter sp. TMH8 TaxID=2848611 RepID=UPI001CCA1FC1|nr:methionine synthase [Methanobrevibacter sp. TMH8]MBZ9570668.1 methionine synthase [Methanobrevibacter sp. TMH8]
MISTVVGSYPVYKKEGKSRKNKILSYVGTHDPCKIAIQHSVESQLTAGIDIISDGQVRGEMVELFTKSVPGFKIEGNTYVINSKIAKHHKSIGASDLKLAIKYMNNFLKNSNFTDDEKAKKGVKGIVTGPCTIVQSSKLGPIYKDKNTAILDMAHVLMDECASLEKAGAKLIQIDEPFISTGLIDMKIAKKAIDIIADEIAIPVALHSCGDVKSVFKDIIAFNVDIIDCEFAGHHSNLNVLAKYANDLKTANKKIGLGVIDTKKSTIDSIDEISNIIEKGISIIGKENLLIDPDCGMKLLSDNVAFSKLKNMVEAMNRF